MVDISGDDRGDCFGDPESMPYSGWSKDTAQYKGCRDHENYIAEQRYDKGMRSFSKSLQGAGGCDGHGGDDKACANDAQCGSSGCDRLGIFGEQFHQTARCHQA